MAGPQVVVEMDGDEAKLFQAYQNVINQAVKMERGQEKMAATTRKNKREQEELARAAKRVYDQTRTPQERYNQKQKELSTLLKQNKIDQETYGRAVAKANAEMRNAATAGTNAFGDKALGMVKQFVGALGITGGVAGMVAAVNKGYETWLQNLREIGEEAKRAGDEVVAFAALQEGGKKAERVVRAGRVAAQYGIVDRGAAWDTVQAMQSVLGGDFEQGLKAAETIFAARLAGIPVELGKELEVLGAAQKQAPGEALRRAFVAGEASGRTPATLAKAAPGLTFWTDKEVGFAAAAVLSGAVKEDELQTYVKRAGTALATTGPLQKQFEQWGMGKASQLERIRELAKREITSPEAAKKLGVEEIRESFAVATLAANVGAVESALADIRMKAKPGLFVTKRRDIEKELPTLRTQRQIEELQALYAQETALGAAAPKALEQERKQRLRALALRRLGAEQAGPFDLIDEEGRATRGDLAELVIGQLLPFGNQQRLPGLGEVLDEMSRLEEDIEAGRPLRPTRRSQAGPWRGSTDTMGAYAWGGNQAVEEMKANTQAVREGNELLKETNQKLHAIQSDARSTGRAALAGAGHDPEGH